MKPALQLHWPALVVLALIVSLGAGALLLPEDSTVRAWAAVLWGVVPVAFAIGLYAYQRVERFRLQVNRWRFTILNPASTWGLVAEFEVADGLTAWKSAAQAVEHSLRPGDRRMIGDDGNAVWTVGGVTIQATATVSSDPLEGETPLLRIEVPPVTRPFRSWERAIDDEIGPLVNSIETAVRPDEQKFVVRVTFPGENPYFGLFVAQVQRTAVVRFDIEFFEQAANERDAVRVRNDRVEIVTSTLVAALRLSRRYLALAEPAPR